MPIENRVVHEERILGRFTEAEVKEIILNYVAQMSSIEGKDYKHSTRIIREVDMPLEFVCEVTVDMGSKP